MRLPLHTEIVRFFSSSRRTAALLVVVFFFSSAATPAAGQTFLGCLEADGGDGSSFSLVTTNAAQAGDAVVYFAGARQGNQDDGTTTIADLEDDFAFPNASIDDIRVHGGIDAGGLFAPQVYYIDFDAAAIPSGTSVPITETGAGSGDFGVCAVAISNVDQVAVADLTSDTGTSTSTTISTATLSVQNGDVLLAGFSGTNQYEVVSSSGSGAASGLTLYTPLNTPNNINTFAGGTASTSGNASYQITYNIAEFASASILAFRGSPNSDPVFASGASTSLSVDEDDAATSLSTLLEVDDSDTGQTLTWSVASAPSSGTLSGFPATASSGTGVQPSGVTYEPNTDFVGSDSFEIQVSDGNGGTDNVTVNVTVNNLAPVFTSAATASFTENNTGTVLDNDATNGGDGTADSGVTYTISGTDAGAFSIDSATGALSFQTAPDFENPSDANGNNEYLVDVTADDEESSNNTTVQSVAITVTDVNEPPTVALSPTSTSIAEGTAAPVTVSTITVTDDGTGTNSLSLTGTDAGSFAISGTDLQFTGTADFETQSSYSVTVNVDDTAVGTTPDDSESFTLSITDVNEAPTVAISPTSASLPEDTDTTNPVDVSTISVTDDALGTNTLSLSGADAGTFQITGTTLQVQSGATLTPGTRTVTVNVDDPAIGSGAEDSETFTLTVTDVNSPPTVALSPTSASIAEGTAAPVTVSTITVTDDGTGTNSLSLTGTDAGSFAISGTDLQFTGTADFETQSSYGVTVNVDDTAVGTTPDDSESFTLSITDVTADLAIVDGSSAGLDFSASVTPGTANNPVGVVELSASLDEAVVNAVSITNDNPGVAGISAARLFASTDATLDVGTDTELASLPVDNTNAPAAFNFSGLSEEITTTATYFIFAVDVDASAPGNEVLFSLADPAALTIPDGAVATVNGTSQTSFADLPLSNASTALPVDLVAFEAVPEDGRVQLRWVTATETGNAGFDVQRRIENSGWTTLSRVSGAGTTTKTTTYRFTDESIPYDASGAEYRLRQVDVDGGESFSKDQQVEFAGPDQIELLGTFPNPASHRVTVRYAVPQHMSDGRMTLFDMLGRKVRSMDVEAKGKQVLTMQTSTLAPGIYFLRLTSGGQVKTQKITVVR